MNTDLAQRTVFKRLIMSDEFKHALEYYYGVKPFYRDF
jgi:hypothetical protein